MSRRSQYLILSAVAVVAAALGVAAARWSTAPVGPEHALLLETPRELPAFSLVDHHGRPFELTSLSGRWTLVFFGFTHCPDVCPSTLFTLKQVSESLADLAEQDRPAVVMISVDPGRDTPEKLASYVPYFDPGFIGVTGDMPQIMSLTKAMGVAFAYTPLTDGGEGYSVDHTASIFLLDPQGRLAAIFGTPHAAERIVGDYRRVLEARG